MVGKKLISIVGALLGIGGVSEQMPTNTKSNPGTIEVKRETLQGDAAIFTSIKIKVRPDGFQNKNLGEMAHERA